MTGGAGFIGSALVRRLVGDGGFEVMNLDRITYAGNLASLDAVEGAPAYAFRRVDVGDAAAVARALADFQPDVVTHLAAESHVDRSVGAPGEFVRSNIVGTFVLLTQVIEHWRRLAPAAREAFRFHHISTDEVFGSLGSDGSFVESTPYDPSSPYSASKAASDHLVRAWGRTYGLPVLLTNCSNNYGPYHHPEKLIPRMIVSALLGRPLPVYGSGGNVRDWLHVEDHVEALIAVFERGTPGETYLVGGRAERTNLAVVEAVCACLDAERPLAGRRRYADQIAFVGDRPGHDFRYAIDPSKIERELKWSPRIAFDDGLAATVRWYVANEAWWRPIVGESALVRSASALTAPAR